MIQREIVVTLQHGLHARPACQLAALSMGYKSALNILFQNDTIDLKDLMMVASSNINCGDKVIVTADGVDEEEAIEKIEKLLSAEEH